MKWFAKSSGTTNNRSKYIPVPDESLSKGHFLAGQDMLTSYTDNVPDTKLYTGNTISLGGTLQKNPFGGTAMCGDVSAVVMQNLPFWPEMRSPSLEVALMEKWEEKLTAILAETINQKITSLSGVPTWMVLLLKEAMATTGKSTVTEIWPDLELFVHGAVSFTPYRQLFDDLIGRPDMQYLEVYNASEGYFAFQDDLSLAAQMLLLTDHGIFYEFIPVSEVGQLHPKSLRLGEVEKDVNYALVITTNGGLWRYLIGDTVRFSSLHPYRLKVTGRTKHFINAFGEEVVVENAESGIAEACKQTGAIIENYTAAPVFMGGQNNEGRGGHEWVIEFVKEPDSLTRFAEALDSKIRELNADYDAKRYQDMALVMPIVHAVRRGAFYDWLKKQGKLGGQYKVPRLSNSREYVEELLNEQLTL